MLIELEKRAIAAEKDLNFFYKQFSDWDDILGNSGSMLPLLNLDISPESKKMIANLVDIVSVLDKTYKELEDKKDKLILEFALAKSGGKLGDIIDFIGAKGKTLSIVIECAHLMGNSVCVSGHRFLKSGRVGIHYDTVSLTHHKWALRK